MASPQDNENDGFDQYLQDEKYCRQPSPPPSNPGIPTESQVATERPSSLSVSPPPPGGLEYQESDPYKPQPSIEHSQDFIAHPNGSNRYRTDEEAVDHKDGDMVHPQSPGKAHQSGPDTHSSSKASISRNAKDKQKLPPSHKVADSRDEDDDLEIIDPRTASEEAQAKWSVPRSTAPSQHSNDKIKVEPIDREPTPSPQNPRKRAPEMPGVNSQPSKSSQKILDILSAQRAMFQNNNQDTTMKEAENTLVPEQGNADALAHDAMEIDAAMGVDLSEDVDWMDEEVVPVDQDVEYNQLVETCSVLESRNNNGKITEEEIFELSKARRRLNNIKKLNAAAHGTSSLFVEENSNMRSDLRSRVTPDDVFQIDDYDFVMDNHQAQIYDDSETELSRRLREEIEDGDIQHPMASMSKAPKPRKPRKKLPKDAKEAYKRQQEDKREKERAKQQRKLEKAKKKSQLTTKKATQKQQRGPRQGVSLMGVNVENNVDIVRLLQQTNIVDDHHQNAGRIYGSGPEITGRNKLDQLNQIFANIPPATDGADRRTIAGDRKKLLAASKSFGYAKVKATDGKWKIAGMKSPLYHHQLLGAQWMIARELSEGRPHGGILADSMGLGKTVETIACIIANPPGPEDVKRGIGATLVVAPAGVLDQWHAEIEKHTEPDKLSRIMIYKSSSARSSVAALSAMDIVLCSYQEIMKQFPCSAGGELGDIARMAPVVWLRQSGLEPGLLHQVDWYRIVLDEAHLIKNYNSKTSIACQNLKSIYRWCLTGTPLMNRIEEFYPYLHFLRANHTMDQATFQKYFCDASVPESRTRLSIVLSYAMLRRTMKSTLLNRPLISLPDPTAIIKYIDFPAEEWIIYEITENRFRAILSTFIAKGDLLRNYGVFMVQLLRLRQCTGHPFMMERTIKECWTLDDVMEARQRLNRIRSEESKPFYKRAKLWVEGRSSSSFGGDDSADNMFNNGSGSFGRGQMGHSFSMNTAFKSLKEGPLAKRVQCGICGDFPVAPWTTECKHTFCRSCLEEYIVRQSAEEEEIQACACPKCGGTMFNLHHEGASDDDLEDAFDEDDGNVAEESQNTRKKRVPEWSKGRDFFSFEPYTTHSTWLQESDKEDTKLPLTSSGKITALKALLLDAFEKQPMEKVVVFVQFRVLARIVGRLCAQEGWPFLYYTGDCPTYHRTKAIQAFTTNSQIKILISGLKCGGLGLNLTMASRCVSLDLWWNHAVEQQAFGRIFRIGQTKKTTMTRIVMKNSVDMRLLSMQAHKLRDVETALADHGKRVEEGVGLSGKQLVNLFGFLRMGMNGEVLGVERDYEE